MKPFNFIHSTQASHRIQQYKQQGHTIKAAELELTVKVAYAADQLQIEKEGRSTWAECQKNNAVLEEAHIQVSDIHKQMITQKAARDLLNRGELTEWADCVWPFQKATENQGQWQLLRPQMRFCLDLKDAAEVATDN